MASANQTPGGYKFAPLVASQQGRANQHEPACFGLSSSWFFPSRSGIPLHAVVDETSGEYLRQTLFPPWYLLFDLGSEIQKIGTEIRKVLSFLFYFLFLISLIADGPDHYHPACGH